MHTWTSSGLCIWTQKKIFLRPWSACASAPGNSRCRCTHPDVQGCTSATFFCIFDIFCCRCTPLDVQGRASATKNVKNVEKSCRSSHPDVQGRASAKRDSALQMHSQTLALRIFFLESRCPVPDVQMPPRVSKILGNHCFQYVLEET